MVALRSWQVLLVRCCNRRYGGGETHAGTSGNLAIAESAKPQTGPLRACGIRPRVRDRKRCRIRPRGSYRLSRGDPAHPGRRDDGVQSGRPGSFQWDCPRDRALVPGHLPARERGADGRLPRPARVVLLNRGVGVDFRFSRCRLRHFDVANRARRAIGLASRTLGRTPDRPCASFLARFSIAASPPIPKPKSESQGFHLNLCSPYERCEASERDWASPDGR